MKLTPASILSLIATAGALVADAGVTAGACFGSPWQAANSTAATNASILPVVIRT